MLTTVVEKHHKLVVNHDTRINEMEAFLARYTKDEPDAKKFTPK